MMIAMMPPLRQIFVVIAFFSVKITHNSANLVCENQYFLLSMSIRTASPHAPRTMPIDPMTIRKRYMFALYGVRILGGRADNEREARVRDGWYEANGFKARTLLLNGHDEWWSINESSGHLQECASPAFWCQSLL